LVIGGAIGGAVGVSMLARWNGDPLETLAGVFLVAPVAGGYLGHLLFLALSARG
jgi:phosphate/sulfate permease